jgi:hypothetical protein
MEVWDFLKQLNGYQFSYGWIAIPMFVGSKNTVVYESNDNAMPLRQQLSPFDLCPHAQNRKRCLGLSLTGRVVSCSVSPAKTRALCGPLR